MLVPSYQDYLFGLFTSLITKNCEDLERWILKEGGSVSLDCSDSHVARYMRFTLAVK